MILKRKKNEQINDDGTYVVKKNNKMNIGALIVCILIAFAIWVYAENAEAKEKQESADSFKLFHYVSDCKTYNA